MSSDRQQLIESCRFRADKQCVFVIAVFVWTAATVSITILAAGWAGVPMAYDIETQILGMDAKHDTGSTVKRVRSTKFPYFKVSSSFQSTAVTEDANSGSASTASASPSNSPRPPKQSHTDNPISTSNGMSNGTGTASAEHDDTSEL